MLNKILLSTVFALMTTTAWAADVVLQGDESRLFFRQTDGAKLIEFSGSIESRTDVTGLTCDTTANAVAIIGPDAEVDRYLAMMLVSQASNVPVRVFIDDRPGFGSTCTVNTIRMGKLPL